MNKAFRDTFVVRTYEADYTGHLRLNSLFDYMQESAARNAQQLGFGFEPLAAKGFFWVLSRAMVSFERYPSEGESIVVETWPKGVDRLFALRDFRFYDDGGRELGVGTTAWLVVKAENMRPAKPDSLDIQLPDFGLSPAIDQTPGKIDEPDEKKAITDFTVSYSDIDINRHTNNAKYVGYALDAIPPDLFENRQITTFRINFLAESKLGDRLSLFRGSLPDGAWYVDAANTAPGREASARAPVKIFQAEIRFG